MRSIVACRRRWAADAVSQLLGPIRALLFDFGHTLFDTASSIDLIVRESASLGHPIPHEVALALWTSARNRSRTAEELARGRDLSEELHRKCWLELWTDLEQRCPGISEPLYAFETSSDGWTPYPDTEPVLRALRERGIPIAVVSDAGWDLVPVLERHRVREYVTTVVMSYRMGVTKPAPVMFHAACEQLGVDAHEALMVGDNYRNDGGAADAGLRVLLLPMVPSGSHRGLDAVLALVDASRPAG
jgi:HAD superfamily hydrolase (TIGR01509 family)